MPPREPQCRSFHAHAPPRGRRRDPVRRHRRARRRPRSTSPRATGERRDERRRPRCTHYKAAIAIDSNDYAALWKASREAVSLGEFDTSKTQQKAYYRAGRGVRAAAPCAVNPNGTDGWFVLARAIGRNSLTLGKKERVHFAKEIRERRAHVAQVRFARTPARCTSWAAGTPRSCGSSGFSASSPRTSWAARSSTPRAGIRRSST